VKVYLNKILHAVQQQSTLTSGTPLLHQKSFSPMGLEKQEECTVQHQAVLNGFARIVVCKNIVNRLLGSRNENKDKFHLGLDDNHEQAYAVLKELSPESKSYIKDLTSKCLPRSGFKEVKKYSLCNHFLKMIFIMILPFFCN